MNRKNFIKGTGVIFGGLTFGLTSASSLFLPSYQFELFQPTEKYIPTEEPLDPASPFWFGWLARLVLSSLVSSLVAKVVDNMISEPICVGDKCKLKNANYSGADGIYGYKNVNSRFYKQDINDSNVQFQNVSVPFVYQREQACGAPYTEITKIEGPYLVGLCKMTDHLLTKNSVEAVRSVIVPTRTLYNSGYRFDVRDCNNSSYVSYETNYGRTDLNYDVTSGIIETNVYDRNNKPLFRNNENNYNVYS